MNRFILMSFISIIILFISCGKDSNNNSDDTGPQILFVETLAPIYNGGIEAILNGKINDAFSFEISERGFVYSSSPSPTLDDEAIFVDGTTGSYTGTVFSLTINTTYYVRAFVIYSEGTIYGETQEFSTIDDNYIFTKDYIWPTMLHNAKDDLIYIFHKSEPLSGGSVSLSISAFNYSNATIVAEGEVGHAYNSEPLHSIGIYNLESELYIINNNFVKILDANLNEIGRINLNVDAQISDVELKNNLLFISIYSNANTEGSVFVFDRDSLNLLSREEIYSTPFIMTIHPKPNSSNLLCSGFTRNPANNASQYEYSPDGTLISTQNYSYLPTGGGETLRSNDAINYIIKGQYVFQKDDLYSNSSPINNGLQPEDIRLSEDGSVLYSIQRNSLIEFYDTSNFNLLGSIQTRPEYTNRKLFIDNGETIIIHWDFNQDDPSQVFFTKYDL